MKELFLSDISQKLFLAFVLGGILGFERQRHGRAAGLRTHILVCLASTLLMVLPDYIDVSVSSHIDPFRLAAGIMTGIGFIGAGTILRSQSYIRGLTTAACVWLTAAIGIVIGVGQFQLALSVTGVSFFVLWIMSMLDTVIPTETYRILTVKSKSAEDGLSSILDVCTSNGARIVDVDIIQDKSASYTVYRIHLKFSSKVSTDRLFGGILSLPDVERVVWKSE